MNNEKRNDHWLAQWTQPLTVVLAVVVAVVGATFYVVNELARVDQGQADMKAQLAEMKAELAGFDGLELRLGRHLEERWETRLDMFERRLDERWETRLGALEARLEQRWETRLEALETRLEILFAGLRDEMRDDRRQIRDEMSKVENSVVSLSERVAVLEAAQES